MIDTILRPIELGVAWIMVMFHKMLSLFMAPESGWTWVLSIVGLVLVIRVLLIPLFVKQIRASRAMQLIQPEIRKIQAKYKGKTDPASRQAMSQETMQAYRDAKTNPFSSCLPILLQMPIFFALFRVLYYKIHEHAGEGAKAFGILTQELANQANTSVFALGVGISDRFIGGDLNTKIVTSILILLMCGTTFLTQHQLTMKNLPKEALEGPMAQQQKIMLYILPFIFLVSGPGFPIGVLVYWLTTNVWSMGQQYLVIHNSPAPGSEAEKHYYERINRKRAHKGLEPLDPKTKAEKPKATTVEEPKTGQRQQPMRKDRAKKKTQSTERPQNSEKPDSD